MKLKWLLLPDEEETIAGDVAMRMHSSIALNYIDPIADSGVDSQQGFTIIGWAGKTVKEVKDEMRIGSFIPPSKISVWRRNPAARLTPNKNYSSPLPLP